MARFLASRTALIAGLVAGGAWLAGTAPAAADLRLCNSTASRVGVAIGYKEGEGWTTEGWWNIAPKSCETILRGTLVARYYYLYAVDYDQGGEWSGRAFMCARDREFTIRGIEHCLTRGYDRIGFFEVDTQDQRQWTVQLTDETQRPQQSPPMAAPVPPTAPVRPASGSPDARPEIRQAAPGRPAGSQTTPLPTGPAGTGGGAGGVPAGVPAFVAPR
ncbi:DUF1036 domain-containing protein [Phreatobacter sp.]|uniref:DUF1036 domain-containing protein n=1 Tax=Phreatobacter sp. TaxID=1966341 RepID=UPI003F71B44E